MKGFEGFRQLAAVRRRPECFVGAGAAFFKGRAYTLSSDSEQQDQTKNISKGHQSAAYCIISDLTCQRKVYLGGMASNRGESA